MTKEGSLKKAGAKLTTKQKKVADNPSIENVKEVYNAPDTHTAELIKEELSKNPAFQEYSWKKHDLIEIEDKLKKLALHATKEEVQLKAAQYIHDKIYGKAPQKTEITGAGGQALSIIFDSAFDKPERNEDNNS